MILISILQIHYFYQLFFQNLRDETVSKNLALCWLIFFAIVLLVDVKFVPVSVGP
jgi:hypothetical protein